MKKLLVLLLVLLALLVVGDRWVKAYTERRLATELQGSFDDAGEANVQLSGFPFVFRLLSGSIPSVEVSSSSLRRRGVTLNEVHLTMHEVGFSLSQIAGGDLGSVTIGEGEGRASIPVARLKRLFGASTKGVGIELDGSKLQVQLGPARGAAELLLEGTALVLRVPALNRSFTVDLPRFIEGMEYRSVRITGTEVVIEFTMRDSSFEEI